MKPSTILKKARKLIERGWCLNASARTKTGKVCNIFSKRAVQWCAYGAVSAVSSKHTHRPAIDMLDKAVARTDCGIIAFNDRQASSKPVLRAFDRAIALAMKEGQ